MPYFYFDRDDQIHYARSLFQLPEYLFGDTEPLTPVSLDDGGDWTLDNVLAALKDSDEQVGLYTPDEDDPRDMDKGGM